MKYLSIIVVAALTLVSCGGSLDACGCVSEAISIIEDGDCDLDEDIDYKDQIIISHPECAGLEERLLEKACPEEVEKLKSVAKSKCK